MNANDPNDIPDDDYWRRLAAEAGIDQDIAAVESAGGGVPINNASTQQLLGLPAGSLVDVQRDIPPPLQPPNEFPNLDFRGAQRSRVATRDLRPCYVALSMMQVELYRAQEGLLTMAEHYREAELLVDERFYDANPDKQTTCHLVGVIDRALFTNNRDYIHQNVGYLFKLIEEKIAIIDAQRQHLFHEAELYVARPSNKIQGNKGRDLLAMESSKKSVAAEHKKLLALNAKIDSTIQKHVDSLHPSELQLLAQRRRPGPAPRANAPVNVPPVNAPILPPPAGYMQCNLCGNVTKWVSSAAYRQCSLCPGAMALPRYNYRNE